MPEFSAIYRGRKVMVDLDKNGMVLDIYPIDKGDKIIVTESNKIAFEIDYAEKIADVMDEYYQEMDEHRKARGREGVKE